MKLWVKQPPKISKASKFSYARSRSNISRSNAANPGVVFVCNRFLCVIERNDQRKLSGKVMMKSSVNFRQNLSVALVRIVSVLLVSSISVVTTDSPPSCKFCFFYMLRNHINFGECNLISFVWLFFSVSLGGLTEENLLFLEAWRTIDRAYIDKTFNGQSWFRYRETALRNEPMNTREETCMCE